MREKSAFLLERSKNGKLSVKTGYKPLIKKGLLYQEANKEKKTYLYCSSGKRVFYRLFAIGFKKVIPLSEGIIELKTMGLK